MSIIQVPITYPANYALESIVDSADKSFKSMVGSIANFFPSLKSSFLGASEQLATLKAVPSSVLSQLSSYSFNSKDFTYEDFKAFNKVKVVVPESFTGNLHDYAQFLDNSWSFLNTRAIPELDIFYVKLAAFASNKESKISLLDSSGKYKELSTVFQQLVDESVTYFGKTTHNKRSAELGVSFTDFDQYRQTDELTKKLADQLNPKEVSKVLQKVSKIASILDIIIEDAANKEYDKASYEAVKSLATGVFALAQFVEFYSVTYYRITELAFAMGENKAVIKKLK